MKALKDHTILYDGQCPICNFYSKALVDVGIIEDKNRISYQAQSSCPTIDMQRAVNEIALVNNKTGEVQYGIHSIFKLLGNSFPFFKPLFHFAPFVWIASKLYLFISYNRRVIAPPRTAPEKFAYQPTFRKDYRIAYLLFTTGISAFTWSAYANLVIPLIPSGNWYREFILILIVMLLQVVAAYLLHRNKVWDHAGNMATVLFAGSMVLLPVLVVSQFIQPYPQYFLVYFIIVFGWMIFKYISRSRFLLL